METLEITKSIEEDIIKDLSNTETQKVLDTSYYGDFSVILLLVRNSALNFDINSYDTKIFGRKMMDWTLSCFSNYPCRTIPYDGKSNVVSLIKPYLSDRKFTAVFYSDTPLLSRSTVEEIFMYARSRHIGAIKLKRGYVFSTEYVKNIEEISSTFTTNIGSETDYFTVDSVENLVKINEIFHNRINEYHISRGVFIEDSKNVFIDADVEIETGTRIEPFVTIKGQSLIGKHCIIGSFSRVENSILQDNSQIYSSNINECRVERCCVVKNENACKKVIL